MTVTSALVLHSLVIFKVLREREREREKSEREREMGEKGGLYNRGKVLINVFVLFIQIKFYLILEYTSL